MVWLVRHRQTEGPAIDRPHLTTAPPLGSTSTEASSVGAGATRAIEKAEVIVRSVLSLAADAQRSQIHSQLDAPDQLRHHHRRAGRQLQTATEVAGGDEGVFQAGQPP